jgi:toxin YoeB
MNVLWYSDAWEDYQYWIETDKKVLKKINSLIKDCQRNPFSGIGNPEPLKHEFSGYWSRRITGEHRIVYKAENDILYIAQCRYHY